MRHRGIANSEKQIVKKHKSYFAFALFAVIFLQFPYAVPAHAANGDNAARANSYDAAWRDGTNGWIANAKAILAGGNQVAGLVIWVGDSLTRDPAMGAWAQRGAGKSAEAVMITNWMHAGQSPQSVDSLDGFALASPYICSARSYTVGDNLGAWDFMGASGMPPDTNPTTARQKLQDCTTYSNALDLTTILAAIRPPQFAIPEVNLLATDPADLTSFRNMLDLMISRHIVPIIITYTYRGDPSDPSFNPSFNLLVDRYNVALKQLAQNMKLPLIDLNAEILARLPFSQWPGRFLEGDAVHYTTGGGGHTS